MRRAIIIPEICDMPLVDVVYLACEHNTQRMPYEPLPDTRIPFPYEIRIATLSRCSGITEVELELNTKTYEADDVMIPTELCTTKAYDNYLKDKCMPKPRYSDILNSRLNQHKPFTFIAGTGCGKSTTTRELVSKLILDREEE